MTLARDKAASIPLPDTSIKIQVPTRCYLPGRPLAIRTTLPYRVVPQNRTSG